MDWTAAVVTVVTTGLFIFTKLHPLLILAVVLGILPQQLILSWMEPHVTGLIDSLVTLTR